MQAVNADQELQRLELVVGRVVAAEEHPGARAPSHLLTIDLGGRGMRQGTVPASQYASEELLDRQLVCALDGDEAVVLGVHSHAKGLVLVVPERDVENGSAVA